MDRRSLQWKQTRWLVILVFWMLSATTPARAGAPPEKAYIRGVVGHAQRFSLSCESRSAVDWAAYWGVKIGEAKFLNKLPRSDNPDVGFVGNPNDVWGYVPPYSYGVHAGPVAALLRTYGLQAEARKGLHWNDLRSEIAAGRPVIVWVVGQMWAGTSIRYTASDGETMKVAPYEHSMILIGYSPSTVNVVDAYTGMEQVYSRQAFLTSWAALGNMAVVGSGPASTASVELKEHPATYTVQAGDYLINLAKRLEIPWQELVALNEIPFPYLLKEGQVLQLPDSSAQIAELPAVLPVGAEMPENIELLRMPAAVGPVLVREFYLALVAKFSGRAAEIQETSFQEKTVPQTAAPQSDTSTPTPVPILPTTYTVRTGDYLKALAQQFGLDWQSLAEMNGIRFPYTIFPGQVLKLR